MTDTTKKTEQPDDLEPIMKFPMDFPIKIMGLNQTDFPDTISALAEEHFGQDFNKNSLKVEFSKTKKYMALTITVTARSREQLDNFYRKLTSHPMVKVAL